MKDQLTTESGVFVRGIRAVLESIAELTNRETRGSVVT